MSTATDTVERVEISTPKKYRFTLIDSTENTKRPGKDATVQAVLKIGCKLDSTKALAVQREFQRTGKGVVGIFPKQVVETMKSNVDNMLAEPANKVFGITTKIEAE